MPARRYSRRDAIGLIAATGALTSVGLRSAAQDAAPSLAAIVERNDAAVRTLLASQITDRSSPWRGGVADQAGLYWRRLGRERRRDDGGSVRAPGVAVPPR